MAVKTPIVGAFLIDLEPFRDSRGVFVEGFVQSKLYKTIGLWFDVRQINIARSEKAGTVRGMHWQDPYPQGKIVMAASGRIFDAIVDVRSSSGTYGKTFDVTLVPQVNALYIPRGVAHGCQALEDGATLIYLVDNDYMPSAERGITPVGAVDWPLPMVNVAARDLKWPTLMELETR